MAMNFKAFCDGMSFSLCFVLSLMIGNCFTLWFPDKITQQSTELLITDNLEPIKLDNGYLMKVRVFFSVIVFLPSDCIIILNRFDTNHTFLENNKFIGIKSINWGTGDKFRPFFLSGALFWNFFPAGL